MIKLKEARFDAVVIHYGEVTLKRSRRGRFEKILRENIERFTRLPVKRLQGRFVIDLGPELSLEEVLERVGKVFGVVWYAPAVKASSLNELQEKLLEILSLTKPRSLKIDTRRSDKRFPMTSLEVSKRLGAFLSSRLGARIDLKTPERTVLVEITEDGIYSSFEKLRGPGGLPLGSSGRVLGLISGGVRSALACWFMMKRGCRVDLLHVYDSSSGEEALKTYLKHNVDKILEYSLKLKLYLAFIKPFLENSRKASADNLPQLLQAFIIKLGESIAEKRSYLGLVLGSSIRDPRYLESLAAILAFRKMPVYTPLLTVSESELKEKAEKLSFQELPRDQASDLSFLRVSSKALEKLWRKCKLDEAVRKTLEKLEVYELRLGKEPRKVK